MAVWIFLATIDMICTPALYIGVGSDGFASPGTGKQLTQTDDKTGHGNDIVCAWDVEHT